MELMDYSEEGVGVATAPVPDQTDHSRSLQVPNGQARIGIYEYPIQGDDVNELNLARFLNKITTGDYAFDSDPLLSSNIYSSFTGGQGNETIKEGVDDDSFWEATLETRFPDGATLLPLTTSHAGTNNAAAAFPLGDFPSEAPFFLASFDDKVHQWHADTQTFELFADLPNNPVEVGVEFDDLFYVPLGQNGYATINGAGVVGVDATEVLHFVLWDRKLCALTTGGELLIMPAGGTFTAPSEPLTLPKSDKPRKLVDFINASGLPTLHIVTNKRVYAYDPDNQILYQTRLNYPKHPDQGLDAVNWRGDSMYVSVGLGIHGYNGSIVQSMGPDGRHGMPSRHRGRIVALQDEYNSLLALVEGVAAGALESVDEEYRIHRPLYQNQNTWHISNYTYEPVYSTLLRWSNSQWHKVWESPVPSGTPSWMAISEAQNEYRLWWGYGAEMYTQKLPVAFQNPKQYLRSGEQEFMPTGRLITGWYDADMAAFDKLATHVEVNLHDVTGLGEPGGSVTVEYQYDDATTWRLLGTADTVNRTVLPFRNKERAQGQPFSIGLAWNKIRFRITYNQKTRINPDTDEVEQVVDMSPLMTSMVFKFIKIPDSQLSWSFTVPLTMPQGFNGMGNEVLRDYLEGLLTSLEMTTFTFKGEEYRVRVAQVSSNRHTGAADEGIYNVNLVEVRLGEERRNTVTKYIDMVPSG